MTETNGALAFSHEKYFEELEKVTHRELAVAAALNFCAQYGLPPPQWVVREAATSFIELLKDQRPKKRGRNAGHLARYRQDMIDIERWDAVKVVREKQAYFKQQHELAQSHSSITPRMKADIKKAHTWAGNGWSRAYECAAMYLRGSDAYAGPDAMKASYLKVNLAGKSRTKGNRYYIFDVHFLNKIATPLHVRKQARKIGALFDLTM